MINQEFIALLDKMKEIHEKKAADYSSKGHYDNFEKSAQLASWFDDSVDKSFAVLIGTKLARLSTLLNKKESPKNESIDDSFLDLTVYCALWASYRKNFSDRIKQEFLAEQARQMQNAYPYTMFLGPKAR